MMKTKLMSMAALALLAVLNANAQIEKGTWLLGGGVSHNKLTDEDISSLAVNENKNTNKSETLIAISAGKAFRKNNLLGFTLGYSRFESVDQTKLQEGIFRNESKSDQLSAGVFHRIYKPLSDNFYLFGQTTAMYSYGKTGSDGRRHTVDLSISPGLAYQISKKVHAELSLPRLLSASYSKWKNGAFSSSNFSAAANLSHNPIENIGIGFTFFIP